MYFPLCYIVIGSLLLRNNFTCTITTNKQAEYSNGRRCPSSFLCSDLVTSAGAVGNLGHHVLGPLLLVLDRCKEPVLVLLPKNLPSHLAAAVMPTETATLVPPVAELTANHGPGPPVASRKIVNASAPCDMDVFENDQPCGPIVSPFFHLW